MTLKKAQSHRGNKEKTEKRHKINKIKYMMIYLLLLHLSCILLLSQLLFFFYVCL